MRNLKAVLDCLIVCCLAAAGATSSKINLTNNDTRQPTRPLQQSNLIDPVSFFLPLILSKAEIANLKVVLACLSGKSPEIIVEGVFQRAGDVSTLLLSKYSV